MNRHSVSRLVLSRHTAVSAQIGGYDGARGYARTPWVPKGHILERVIQMPRNINVVVYILVLIAVVVSVDLLFFKNRFWERLIVNIGIVLVFAAFYLRFLKNP
jgi:hypothetical protein